MKGEGSVGLGRSRRLRVEGRGLRREKAGTVAVTAWVQGELVDPSVQISFICRGMDQASDEMEKIIIM